MAWGTSRVSGNMAYHAYFWLKRSVCQKIFDPFSQNSTWELGLLKTDLKSFANFLASSHQLNYLLLNKIYGKRNVRVVNNYAETTMTLRISMVNFWRPLTGFKEIFKRKCVINFTSKWPFECIFTPIFCKVFSYGSTKTLRVSQAYNLLH